MDSSIAAVMSTSPTSGAFRIVLGPSPSIAATMCLVTAFFEPRTWMSPRSGPDGSTCQVSVTQTTVGARPLRSGAVHRTFRSSTGSTGSGGSASSAGRPPAEPGSGGGKQHGAHGPAQRDGAEPYVLQPGGQNHEGDDRPDEAVRCPGRQQRADQHRGHAADDDGGGDPE